MGEYSISEKYKGAYRIDASRLQRVAAVMERHTGKKPTATVHFKSDHSVRVADIDMLDADPIVAAEQISGIYLISHGSDLPLRTASVALVSRPTAEFVGDKGACLLANNDLSAIMRSSRTWYSVAYFGDWIYFVGAIVVSSIAGLITQALIGPAVRDYLWYVFMSYLFGTLFLCWVASKLLFRPVEIMLGKSEQNANWRNGARKFVFVTLLVGGAIALFNRFLGNSFGM